MQRKSRSQVAPHERLMLLFEHTARNLCLQGATRTNGRRLNEKTSKRKNYFAENEKPLGTLEIAPRGNIITKRQW